MIAFRRALDNCTIEQGSITGLDAYALSVWQIVQGNTATCQHKSHGPNEAVGIFREQGNHVGCFTVQKKVTPTISCNKIGTQQVEVGHRFGRLDRHRGTGGG